MKPVLSFSNTARVIPGKILLLLLAVSCSGPERQLNGLQARYQEQVVPLLAPAEGLPVVSPRRQAQALNAIGSLLKELEILPEEKLGENFTRFVQQLRRQQDSLLSLQQDPALYNLGGYLQMVDSRPMPAAERDTLLFRALAQAEVYYDSAKAILYQPDSARLELAIQKQQATLIFLDRELSPRLDTSTTIQQGQVSAKTQLLAARFAVKDYLAYCRSLLFDYQDSLLYRR